MSIKGKFLKHTKEEIKKMLEGTELHKEIKERRSSDKKKVRFPERMRVKDVMKEPVKIKENTKIRNLLDLLEETQRTCFIVVDDENRVKGIVTDSDLLKIVRKPRKRRGVWGVEYRCFTMRGAETAGDIMTKNPISVKPECKLEDATSIMRDYKIRHLPVIDEGKLVGTIDLRDILLVLRILL